MQDMFNTIQHWALHHCVVFDSFRQNNHQELFSDNPGQKYMIHICVSTFMTIMRNKW